MESILKKVEDSWKSAEFVVLPHRDSKDVFILGGIDEVQVKLQNISPAQPLGRRAGALPFAFSVLPSLISLWSIVGTP